MEIKKLEGRDKVNAHIIANKVNELIDELGKLDKAIEESKKVPLILNPPPKKDETDTL